MKIDLVGSLKMLLVSVGVFGVYKLIAMIFLLVTGATGQIGSELTRDLRKKYGEQNVVAAGLASRCEIQVSYAIGVAHPLSINVETFGTGNVPDEKISELVDEFFDLRPGAIIRDLDLRRPIYQQLAAYGHFGREEPGFTWEKKDRVKELLKLIR